MATVMLRYENGARGVFAVSQLSAGRKNQRVRGRRLGGAAAWDQENPDQLWLGHRDQPNEILLRNLVCEYHDGGRHAARRTPRASPMPTPPTTAPFTPTSWPAR